MYVLERDQDNLYVHHDYLLPAFPLALAWLDFFVGAPTADDVRPFADLHVSAYILVGTPCKHCCRGYV